MLSKKYEVEIACVYKLYDNLIAYPRFKDLLEHTEGFNELQLVSLIHLINIAKAFIKDDFPTFERPIKANSGKFKSGHSLIVGALVINFAFVIFIF